MLAHMAEPKTKPTDEDPRDYLTTLASAQRREEGEFLIDLLERISGERAMMWGTSIIGFSPRSTKLSIYLVDGASRDAALLEQLGPHSTGKACLYVKRLTDVDLAVLEQLCVASLEQMRATHEVVEVAPR